MMTDSPSASAAVRHEGDEALHEHWVGQAAELEEPTRGRICHSIEVPTSAERAQRYIYDHTKFSSCY